MTNENGYTIISFVAKHVTNVRLAQLDRAFGYGPKGREFESSSARYKASNVLFGAFSLLWRRGERRCACTERHSPTANQSEIRKANLVSVVVSDVFCGRMQGKVSVLYYREVISFI